jgi:hypothetical protein
MATRIIGVKTTSQMKTTDYLAIGQERNRSLYFILSIGILITKLALALALWKYAGLLLSLMF